MRTWYQKALGDGVAAYGPMQQILEAVKTSEATGGPHGMAIFSRHDLRENLVTVYFSPEAKMLAEAFGASLCDRPSREGLNLLAGDARSWTILSPKSE